MHGFQSVVFYRKKICKHEQLSHRINAACFRTEVPVTQFTSFVIQIFDIYSRDNSFLQIENYCVKNHQKLSKIFRTTFITAAAIFQNFS